MASDTMIRCHEIRQRMPLESSRLHILIVIVTQVRGKSNDG